MLSAITFILLLVGTVPFIAKRLLRYLHFYQLEEYDGTRFLSWIWTNKSFDTRGSFIALIAWPLIDFGANPLLTTLLSSIFLFALAYIEPDPRHLAKVSLKLTDRAKRIYTGALIITFFLDAALIALTYKDIAALWLTQIILFQAIPITLVLSCRLLRRDEQNRQDRFQNEAQRILTQTNPYTIGITGSYGKTSTKDALGRILQVTLAPTFWPQKSINTVMGITKEIRTHMKNGIKYAVVEMGAYRPGSIDRLCRLTPPNAAIITCVGVAHLERFGSPENIFKAKSELAKNVPANGILVCNGDDEGARRIAQENPKALVIMYGLHPEKSPLDVWISDYKTTPSGTEFVVHWHGASYKGFTPLFGKTALSNILAAFSMACALGANPVFVLGAIRNLQPVDNRLELKKDGGVTYLRDAYNSNPAGFKAALDVLAALPSTRKILMTPGMIELGTEQGARNEEIGRYAGTICDIAIVVGNTNKDAIETGIKSGGMDPRNIYWCATREEAFDQLKLLTKEGDSILIENDLTDLYVRPKKF